MAVYSLNELKNIVAPVAARYNLKSVWVFGSYAKGTAGEDSDVDLLVDISGSEITGLMALGALYGELETALGKPVDLITADSLQQPARRRFEHAFREAVEKEKVGLYAIA